MSNLVMLALKDLIPTQLYKYLNIIVHQQWESLFPLYLHSRNEYEHISSNLDIINYSNNSDDENVVPIYSRYITFWTLKK